MREKVFSSISLLMKIIQKPISSTAKEIWNDTNGEITHFVSSMGTTGTIMGVSKYLKEKKSISPNYWHTA